MPPDNSSTTFSAEIPEALWEPSPDYGDARLFAVIAINGVRFHAEAIRVRTEQERALMESPANDNDSSLEEEAFEDTFDSDAQSRYDALCAEFGVRGFRTITIFGHPYALFITPFEN